jgi:hypothetical protein
VKNKWRSKNYMSFAKQKKGKYSALRKIIVKGKTLKKI